MALVALALGLLFSAGPASAAAPEVLLEGATEAAYTTVHVAGKVDPKGEFTVWSFELSTDGGMNWEGRLGGEFFGGETGLQSVAGEIEGLIPGQSYQLRLRATNFVDAPAISSPPNPEFTTKAVVAPTVSLDPITTKTATTALLKGKIDPNSPGGLDPVGEAAYLTHYSFGCSPACPGLEEKELQAEAGEQEVEFEAEGLEPNTKYEINLVAHNLGGEKTAGPQTFSTDEIPATVAVGPGTSAGAGSYVIEGTVNPHNSVITSCTFEYGLTTTYGNTVPCEPLPATVNRPVFVTAVLSGLAVNAAYHFRLSVANGAEPSSSPDAVFFAHPPCGNESIREDQGTSDLPECRAWEQVSAPFKEGFPVILNQYSDDGDRGLYQSSGNFAEIGLGSASNNYLAVRTVTGWSTEAVNPSGPFYAMDEGSIPNFSSDLRTSLFKMSRSDQSIDTRDFYLRLEDGTFERVGPIADPSTLPPTAPGGTPIIGDGSQPALSDELSRIVYPRSVGGVERLFEYNAAGSAEAEPVGVDNTGRPIEPICPEAYGLTLTGVGPKAISDLGRVLVWTRACGSQVGRFLHGELFARIGHTTVAVSASRCDRGASDPCLGGAADAAFAGMADDGSVVYFTSSSQLVDGDTDEAPDLYACNIPPGEPAPTGAFNSCETLTEVTGGVPDAEVEGVVCVSEDGSHIYFVAEGVLAQNRGANQEEAAAGANNLYLWQRDSQHPQGEMTFLARLGPSDSELWPGGGVLRGQTTPTGRFLLLPSHTALIDSGPQADSDGGAVDVYRYDAETRQFSRTTTDSSGTGGNETNANAGVSIPLNSTPASRAHPAISSDGQTVVFATPEALSPFDHNDVPDSYLWHDGEVAMISAGLSTPSSATGSHAFQPTITPDGRNVFFESVDPLLATDTDTTGDLYDARVEGGFPAATVPQPCAMELTCRGAAAPTTAPGVPATISSTPGNPTAPLRCARGKVRKQGRCVSHRHKKRHRAKAPRRKHHGGHRHPAKAGQGGAR